MYFTAITFLYMYDLIIPIHLYMYDLIIQLLHRTFIRTQLKLFEEKKSLLG